MSAAWSRFDAEVEQLKRLSSQLCEQDNPSVPRTLKSQSRKQSAVSRRTLASLRANMPSTATLTNSTSTSDVLVVQVADTPRQDQTLIQLSQHALTEVSRPCAVNTGLSTTTVSSTVSTHRDVFTPTVCTSYVTTGHSVQRLSDVTGVQSAEESDSLHVMWTDQPCVESSSQQLDESVRLVISTGESADISAVSAMTSASVTTVGTSQQPSHGVSMETEVLDRLCQPSTPDRQTAGSRNCFPVDVI